jgi:hypothetical protein
MLQTQDASTEDIENDAIAATTTRMVRKNLVRAIVKDLLDLEM